MSENENSTMDFEQALKLIAKRTGEQISALNKKIETIIQNIEDMNERIQNIEHKLEAELTTDEIFTEDEKPLDELESDDDIITTTDTIQAQNFAEASPNTQVEKDKRELLKALELIEKL